MSRLRPPRSLSPEKEEELSWIESKFEAGIEIGPRGTLKKSKATSFINLEDIKGEPKKEPYLKHTIGAGPFWQLGLFGAISWG